jgi:hypothetical protein
MAYGFPIAKNIININKIQFDLLPYGFSLGNWPDFSLTGM